jgi:hypothetical protein
MGANRAASGTGALAGHRTTSAQHVRGAARGLTSSGSSGRGHWFRFTTARGPTGQSAEPPGPPGGSAGGLWVVMAAATGCGAPISSRRPSLRVPPDTARRTSDGTSRSGPYLAATAVESALPIPVGKMLPLARTATPDHRHPPRLRPGLVSPRTLMSSLKASRGLRAIRPTDGSSRACGKSRRNTTAVPSESPSTGRTSSTSCMRRT